jgi:hypothetical protein
MHISRISIFCVVALTSVAAVQAANVTTHHYDNLRTGWNQSETVLTPNAVRSAGFGLLASVPLDEQVDAQPLLVTGQNIAGALHDVVYVATENDTVYALDAASGAVLLQTSLGTPVPISALPGQCGNNSASVGINGTPVIDSAAGILYVIAYTYTNKKPAYYLHALNIDTLADAVPPVQISAAAQLANNTPYKFNPAANRQRAGMLFANGNVYAGFASFCDINANLSRGWVLGWQAGSLTPSLTPLAANELTDKSALDQDRFYLSSVWMSGSGLAASASGDIYFVTGNSDPSGNAYNSTNNISESVVQMSSDLSSVKSIFTPVGANYGHVVLDQDDLDFASGGVVLLPPQNGAASNLAVAVGKVGIMYLLNADSLRNGSANATGSAIQTQNIGGACWCVSSYYTADDGFGRVVSSGGGQAIVWKVTGGATRPLTRVASSSAVQGNGAVQDPGFFTTVSSNGTKTGSVVIWAVGRPADSTNDLRLYAFAEHGNQLFSAVPGTWPNLGGNANVVPVVANGKVYVASYKSLAIYGLGAGSGAALASTPRANEIESSAPPADEQQISGIVQSIDGSTLTLVNRAGDVIKVDGGSAFAHFQAAPPAVGHAILVRGTIDDAGVMHATTLLRAKNSTQSWQPDR